MPNQIFERISLKTTSDKIPTVEYEDIRNDLRELNKDYFMKFTNKEGILFENGDILFGKLRPYLKNHVLSTFTGKAVGDFWILRSILNKSHFNFYLIDTPFFVNISNITIGTRMPRSDWNTMNNFTIYIPTEPESTKIGDFFQQLDKLITLYQRKLKVFTSLQKFLLHNIFPHKNSQLPVLRFLYFNQKWKNEVFKDVIITQPAEFYTKNTDMDGQFPIIQQGDQPVFGFSNENPFREFLNVVLFGDHTVSIYKPTRPFLVATNGIKLITSNLLTRDFLYYSLLKYKPNPEGYKRHFSLLKLKKIKYTTNVDEQIYISNLINNISESVYLIEKKHQNLINFKKIYLSKMYL